MAIISLTLPADGDYIKAIDYNTPLGIIQNLLNGNLANDNILDGSLDWTIFNTSTAMPSSLLAGAFNGWMTVTDAWSYASATTITIPAGGTSLYQAGMPFTITQGGTAKYGYIVKVASTLLTVTTLNDASSVITSVANSAISAIKVGLSGTVPIGHPEWLNYNATWSTTGTQPVVGNATYTQRFRIMGKKCEFNIYLLAGSTTTFGTGLWRFTTPATSKNANQSTIFPVLAVDSGTRSYVGTAVIGGNVNTFIFEDSAAGQEYSSTNPFSWGTSDVVHISGSFEYDS